MENFIDFINSAPKFALEALNDKIAGKLDKLEADNFPLLGEIIVGKMTDPANDRIYGATPSFSCPELEVLVVEFQSTGPRDESGFGTMGPGLSGNPIRIFIGSKYTGIILQYDHSSKTWSSAYSHGNFGKKYASGGTWSGGSLYANRKEGRSCLEAFVDRQEFGEKHVYSKSEEKWQEKFCISQLFWDAARRDLEKLGLI